MTRIDFDSERATLAAEPLEFILFGRTWHGAPQITLAEKRALIHRMTGAMDGNDPDEAMDSFLDMVGSLVIPAERDEFVAVFEKEGDEALAMRVTERLMEAYAGRPTSPPNGSSRPSGRTSRSSTAGARRGG